MIALSTTSHFIAASSVDASGPSITVTPGKASRMRSAFLIVPTVFTPYFLACAITTSGFDPADEIASTENNSGFASIISSA